MIRCEIVKSDDVTLSIILEGHAMSGDPGQDLVCAGVSSIAFGALNALDLLFKSDCDLLLGENRITIEVTNTSPMLQNCLQFLEIQLYSVEEAYPENIQIDRKEV